MMDKLNFLILHNMGHRSTWLSSVADIELALPRYAPQHNYIVHNAVHQLPDFSKYVDYDCIIIGPSFLSGLPDPIIFKKIMKNYNFIRNHDAYKIALPQDDYWCSEVKDDFFLDFGISEVRPVCEYRHWNLLYPKFSQSMNKMAFGYTGYITPRLRKRSVATKLLQERKYDVVYRAKGKPYFPNRLGFLKAQIGEMFKNASSSYGLNLNISVSVSDTIRGDGWLDFIENSKCILGSNSGSSVLIRNHEVAKKIREYEMIHPDSTYKEIVDANIPEIDKINEFTAISPRNLEAGLMGTTQILIPGPYSGILHPSEQYIPLKEDCSNIDEIIDILKDIEILNKIARSCRSALLDFADIQVEEFVKTTVNGVENHLSYSHKRMTPYDFDKLSERYKRVISLKDRMHSSTLASKNFLRNVVPSSILDVIRRKRFKIRGY